MSACFALSFSFGCGSDTQVLLPDVGAPDGGMGERRIEVLTVGSLLLGFGEEGRVDVRVVRGDGTGVSGAPVRFALDGTANDASLDVVSVGTDRMGNAGTRVIAGGASGTFRVRATTEGAVAVFIDVAISDAGFGTVRVSYADESERSPVVFVAELYTGTGCQLAEAGGSPDRVVAFLDGQSMLSFLGLAAGPTYSVLVRGTDVEGEEVAIGCNDGVLVPTDGEAVVTVTLAARERLLAAGYDAKVSFALGPLHTLADGAASSAVTSLLGGSTEAAVFLDALGADLRLAGFEAEADALEDARSMTSLEADFGTHLVDTDSGLSVAALEVTSALRQMFTHAELVGTIGFDDAPLLATLLLTRTGVGQPPGPLPTVPWLSLIDPIPPSAVTLDSFGLSLGVDLHIALGAGSALAVLLDLIEATDAASYWGAAASVDEVASFALPAGIEAACNTVCRAGVFRSVSVRLSERTREAFGALDADHAGLALVGMAQTVDDDRDFVSDAFVGSSLTATWGTGVDFTGQLLATRPE